MADNTSNTHWRQHFLVGVSMADSMTTGDDNLLSRQDINVPKWQAFNYQPRVRCSETYLFRIHFDNVTRNDRWSTRKPISSQFQFLSAIPRSFEWERSKHHEHRVVLTYCSFMRSNTIVVGKHRIWSICFLYWNLQRWIKEISLVVRQTPTQRSRFDLCTT